MDLFQPDVTSLQSTAVTVKEQPIDTTDAKRIEQYGGLAAEAGFSLTKNVALNNLRDKLSKIAQASDTNKSFSRSNANSQAIAALRETKASVPWAVNEADSVYREFFGGSGRSTGLTPQEKYQQDVETLALRANISFEDAANRIQISENAKASEEMAKIADNDKKANSDVIYNAVNSEIIDSNIGLLSSVNKVYLQEGGKLSEGSIASFNMAISSKANEMRAKARSYFTDENGRVVVGNDFIKLTMDTIDKWEINSQKIIKDKSYSELVNRMKIAEDSRLSLVAMDKYETISTLNKSGGQSFVNAYLDYASRPNSRQREAMMKFSPELRALFEQDGSLNHNAEKGFDKLIIDIDPNIVNSLSKPQAVAVGEALNSPQGYGLVEAIAQQATNNSSNADAIQSLSREFPDSVNMYISDRFVAYSNRNKEQASVVAAKTFGGLKQAFLSSYVIANQKMPSNISIGYNYGKNDVGQFSASITQVNGEGINKEQATIVKRIYDLVERNPEFKAQLERMTNTNGLSNFELVNTYINSSEYDMGDKPGEGTVLKQGEKGVSQTEVSLEPTKGERFYQDAYDLASSEVKDTGIPPEMVAAMATLETGHGLSLEGNNYFGIKGKGQEFTTHEYVDGKKTKSVESFKKYNSFKESMRGLINLLTTDPRYKPVLEAKTLPEKLQKLQEAGYATDPNYANKLTNIINNNKL